MDDPAGPPRWLWKGLVLALTTLLGGGLALAAAIGAGWHSPRPSARPDWQLAGSLPVEAVAPDEQAVVLFDRTVDTFTLEALATPLYGSDFNGYGLAFRAQGTDQYAVFAVGSDGYLAVLQVDGAAETPLLDWQQFPHVRRGRAANRLRVSCAEGVCAFWVNDEAAGAVPDPSGLPGGVGLWVRRFDGGSVQVVFSEVSLWATSP